MSQYNAIPFPHQCDYISSALFDVSKQLANGTLLVFFGNGITADRYH
jgi:hypothetical protein